MVKKRRLSRDGKTYEIISIDPDGWDRNNYEYSFNEELITKDEFMNRIASSTIKCNTDFFNW